MALVLEETPLPLVVAVVVVAAASAAVVVPEVVVLLGHEHGLGVKELVGLGGGVA